MSFDVEGTAKQMLEAALPVLKHYGKYAIETANEEFTLLAQLAQQIGTDLAAGKTTEAEAKNLYAATKLAYTDARLTQEELGAIAIEDAINAAIAVVAGAVNKYVGFALF